MYTVLIADDEATIRNGLRYIIDWEELGFSIQGEASNGPDALNEILELTPDVVLMDIRMPGLLGIDVVQQSREKGYQGHYIILSGFTDFKYAQAAVQYGVDYYLTKPIDEDELLEAVRSLKTTMEKEGSQDDTMRHYRKKAHDTILLDILTNQADYASLNLSDMNLTAESYQVVIYEKYSHHATQMSYRFSDLLKVANNENSSYENITIDNNEVLLLKGDAIQKKFQQFLEHYEREQKPQRHSPLDSLFITYGQPVKTIENVHISYNEALRLLQRRFFCEHKQHTIGYDQLPKQNADAGFDMTPEMLQDYCTKLIPCLQATKRNQTAELLHSLETKLYRCNQDIPHIKLFLTDIYLSIKEQISHLYHNVDIDFPSNSEIIEQIDSKYYLYEIFLFFTEQFDMIMKVIDKASGENILEEIQHYVEDNYSDNIKLENVAPLFGYNSAYIGKSFTKNLGMSFNAYVDQVRIEHSKKLLTDTYLKVYEISDRVGYRNVDYFHTKFKKLTGMSPAEYRKQNKKGAN